MGMAYYDNDNYLLLLIIIINKPVSTAFNIANYAVDSDKVNVMCTSIQAII